MKVTIKVTKHIHLNHNKPVEAPSDCTHVWANWKHGGLEGRQAVPPSSTVTLKAGKNKFEISIIPAG